jgi:hypothetical protein
MIRTLSDTIIWHAQQRMKHERFQNENSAIHGTLLDIQQLLMVHMAENDEKERKVKWEDSKRQC